MRLPSDADSRWRNDKRLGGMRIFLLWLGTIVLCSAAASGASLSLRAAHLGPSLHLLTWSAPSLRVPLRLTSDSFLGSALTLSPSDPTHLIITGDESEGARLPNEFTLCEHTSSNTQQHSTDGSSCDHAQLPAHSDSWMDAARTWDLSGARLHSAISRSVFASSAYSPSAPHVSDESSAPSASAHRFSWSFASVSADPASPPLLYSLFAEWTAPTLMPRKIEDASAPRTPSLLRHSIRLCSARSRSEHPQLYCDVSEDRLPRGVELTLHLLTECDAQRMATEGMPANCLSAISPAMIVTLPELVHDSTRTELDRDPVDADAAQFASVPNSVRAAAGVAEVHNDAAVRQALCTFFNQTGGPRWTNNDGWCSPSVPVCRNGTRLGWYGIFCDPTGEVVNELSLTENGLASAVSVDISPLFHAIPQLQYLWLVAFELILSPLDLSPLSALSSLMLGLRFEDALAPLTLPNPICQLADVDIRLIGGQVQGWSACTAVTTLSLGLSQSGAPFAAIAYMPLLLQFTSQGSPLNGDPVGSYGGGLTGGELTLFVLAHLNTSNPLLQSMDLGYSGLPFGSPNATDNWPSISAPLLNTLQLDGLPLRTGPQGPINQFWMRDMPALTSISMVGLSVAVINTTAFQYASSSLSSIQADCSIVGDLSSLLQLPLTTMVLSGSELESQLPSNLSAVWPRLKNIQCAHCNLFGPLPDFRHLTELETVTHTKHGWASGIPCWRASHTMSLLLFVRVCQVVLAGNSLSGPIGVDFALDSPILETVVLSANRLVDPLPSFCGQVGILFAAFDSNLISSFPNLTCYQTLQQLELQSNTEMQGSLPSDLWERLPIIENLILSNTRLNGSIPDRDVSLPSHIEQFVAASCAFGGRLPLNINAVQMDLSNNKFDGPLILFDERFPHHVGIQSLTLSSAGQLACPIQLGNFGVLETLLIAGNGFDGCDWTTVTLPSTLTQLDISDNAWLPFDVTIPSQLVSLVASRANIRGLVSPLPAGWPSLQHVTFDGNPFSPGGNAVGIIVLMQLFYLLDIDGSAPMLQTFSARGCGIALDLGTLMSSLSSNPHLEQSSFQDNAIWSEFPFTFGKEGLHPSFPLSSTIFSVANNRGVRGALPQITHVYPNLQSLDFSHTTLNGPIPISWSAMPALTQLSIVNTSIRCDLVVNAQTQMHCDDHSVIAPSDTITIEAESLADPTAGVHCSALTIVATSSASVTADPSYHSHTLCTCDTNSFGINALCYRCPEGCTCAQDRIANCFPVVHRGSIGVQPATAVVAGSVTPFSVTALLPCPRTVTGSLMCNPNGIAWPSFYRVSESVAVSRAEGDPSAAAASEFDLSDWCAPGHTGRLCAACSSGYFNSGRWCLRCLSAGLHVLILIANLMLIVALVAYLYAKSPSAATSHRRIQRYLSRIAGATNVVVPASSARIDAGLAYGSMRHSDAGDSPQARVAHDSADPALSNPLVAEDVPVAVAADSASSAGNPLSLLIFHSQQLSLLLHTSTSLPLVMSGLLSAMSSGSTGFSLTSLVAMECLRSGWSLRERCWMAVVAPALVGGVALMTALWSRRHHDERAGAMQLLEREESLQGKPNDHSSASSCVPRVYSVCVSLLYFLFFPCAATVVAAVSCTDTRESGRSYLNLSPDQACDDEWRRTILPPAVLGILFWIVVFPIASTALLTRLRSHLCAAASSSTSSASLRVWPVCSALLSPYSPRFWYWEQVLLGRRLLLVCAVSLIPSASLYLPLVLFAIIQLSALQQHWAQPYAHPLLNAGELASLYLLIINYISALILQTGLTAGEFHATADGWAVMLFIVNSLFLLCLVVGLFAFIRRWADATLKTMRTRRGESKVRL